MRKVVAVGAHPDDETAFAGGTLARYAAEGDEVTLVSATRGEGGESGDPPLCSFEDLGAVREGELRCAARALGAKDVAFLGFVDPRIEVGQPGRRIDATLDEYAAAIRAVLERIQPDVVLTHGSNGEYGHPQHIFTHEAVLAAIRGLPLETRPSTLYTWAAKRSDQSDHADDRLSNKDDPADFVVDVTPWFAEKLAALSCHRTQHAMMFRNRKTTDLRDLVSTTEAFHRWDTSA